MGVNPADCGSMISLGGPLLTSQIVPFSSGGPPSGPLKAIFSVNNFRYLPSNSKARILSASLNLVRLIFRASLPFPSVYSSTVISRTAPAF